jgi:predicted lysophospholipase L1 biosynthesis ABC-type transport system permease subunit
VFVQGTLRLFRPRVVTGAGPLPLAVDYRDWVASDGSGGGRSASELGIRYFLTQERAFRLRPRQPTDGRPIPVIASRSIADAAGNAAVLPVRVGQADVSVRIAATAERFPSLSGDFLVADRTALETAANAASPGAAVAEEVWIRGGPGAEPALRRAAPTPVAVTSRRGIEDRLRADPVSRAVSIALLVTALVAAALAVLGVLLTVSVDAQDEQTELFDLEALGAGPARLARHLWLRLAVVVAVGTAGGLVTGLAAGLLVTDVVDVTANVERAEPPLVAVVEWPLLVAGLAAFAAIALGAASLIAVAQFRAPAPERPGPA